MKKKKLVALIALAVFSAYAITTAVSLGYCVAQEQQDFRSSCNRFTENLSALANNTREEDIHYGIASASLGDYPVETILVDENRRVVAETSSLITAD